MTEGRIDKECIDAFVRSQIYGITARVLSNHDSVLDRETLDDLQRITNETGDFQALENEVIQIQNSIDSISVSSRELNQEYTSLFLKGSAPPYECSYLPPSRLNQELADISGFYLAFGLQTNNDRQDHLVSEMEFMSFLCLKESIAQGNQKDEEAGICRDAQTKFLEDHLGRWIGVYQRLLSDKARLQIYPQLVGLVHKIVVLDASYLGINLDEITEVPEDEVEGLPGCGLGSNVVG